jgi:predicted nicotinamide N-methyase
VYDLPQLYTKPPASSLLKVLDHLTRATPSFSDKDGLADTTSYSIDPSGLTRYLTSIISSPLSWIEEEDAREQVWAAASSRISERAGRTAMPTMLRKFNVTDQVEVVLREPSLTEDKLGLKTWTSSLLLARRLSSLHSYLPSEAFRVLELGAGTGLVGIAAACIWRTDVSLTDLPDIVPNLQHNADYNTEIVQSFGGKTSVMSLDWSDAAHAPTSYHLQYPVILAADPLYSPAHPRLLAETVERWLLRTADARFIVELPLREGYDQERADLKARLRKIGLQVQAEGTESGYDDWEGYDGQLKEVACWWAVWKFM